MISFLEDLLQFHGIKKKENLKMIQNHLFSQFQILQINQLNSNTKIMENQFIVIMNMDLVLEEDVIFIFQTIQMKMKDHIHI